MRVLVHPEAEIERHFLPVRERIAVDAAIRKLAEVTVLGFPHTSQVGSDGGEAID